MPIGFGVLKNPVDREGTFRAKITDYGLYSAESGAVAVHLVVSLREQYDPNAQQWIPWAQYGQDADGQMWIIKKDGSVNQSAVEMLARSTGWNGDLNAINDHSWMPRDCQVVIRADSYENQVRYRVAFLHEYDSTPGIGRIAPDRLAKLCDEYGMQFRALAANSNQHVAPQRTAAKQNERPEQTAASRAPGKKLSNEEIPF